MTVSVQWGKKKMAFCFCYGSLELAKYKTVLNAVLKGAAAFLTISQFLFFVSVSLKNLDQN